MFRFADHKKWVCDVEIIIELVQLYYFYIS